MKSWVFKLLTFLLTVFLLLSFSLSAFGRPPAYWLAVRELDEQPYPQAFGGSSYFIVIKTSWGIALLHVSVKATEVSNAVTQEKPGSSSKKNDVRE